MQMSVLRGWLIGLAILVGLPFAQPAEAQTFPAVFGARETRHDNLSAFHKWTGMLQRYAQESQTGESGCEERRFNSCHYAEWRGLIASLAGKDRMAQIEAVNGFMNKAPYVTDPVNWGMPDYWATPAQFLRKDGDCEDYAIAKFMTLRELGFSNDDLRIVVLDDLNLRVAHAVLVVRHEDRLLLLDNQVRGVVSADRVRHYKPIFSINETAWWLHR